LVIEISLYYDSWSKKHQIRTEFLLIYSHKPNSLLHLDNNLNLK